MQNAEAKPKVVIIGAGSNIGKACALAATGCDLLLADIEPARLQPLKRFAAVTARYCDVTSEASVLVFANELLGSGDFDVLINAAGNGYVRTLGMTRMLRALIPAMRRTGRLQLLVNVASVGLDSEAGPFVHAGRPDTFLRLSQCFAESVRNSTVDVLTVLPLPTAGIQPRQPGLMFADLAKPGEAGRSIMTRALADIGRPISVPSDPVAPRRAAAG